MRNIMAKLAAFMYGRYGADQFYYFLLGLYFLLIILNVFMRSSIINIIETLLILYTFFRIFSRNIQKRSIENERFLVMWEHFAPDIRFRIRQFKEFRTHAFHKCPYCGSVLRLQRKRGKFPITCPKCNQRFNIRNWF